MLGLFKKKKFPFECPLCSRPYDVRFDPEKVSAEAGGEPLVLDHLKCGFCGVRMAVEYDSISSEVRALDEKWEAQETKLIEIEDLIQAEVERLEREKTEAPDDVSIGKRLSHTRARLAKAREKTETAEERYLNRQQRWQDRYMRKMGG